VAADAHELLAALRLGDDEAFCQIAERELPGIYVLARRLLGSSEDAEDACQEVLLRLHRAGRGLAPGTVLSAWLRRVCVNYCLDVQRGRRRRPSPRPLSAADEPSGAGQSVPEQVEQAAFRRAVQEALQQLTPRQRAVFVLRHLQGCSTKETASILGCAEGTVMVQLWRAVRELRDLLREWDSTRDEASER
jgi:RNA polymerase sigma-70 factor (ECF subfamily)